MTDLSVVDQIGSDRDPAGFRYAQIESVQADCGAESYETPHRPMMGATVDTGRTVHPGDLLVFRCQGSDHYGRELNWWLHPYNNGRHPEIRGGRVEMTWIVHPDSVGDRVYIGVGMAADSRYHRQGGPAEQGYDGWVVFYFRVLPAAAGVPAESSRGRRAAATIDGQVKPARALDSSNRPFYRWFPGGDVVRVEHCPRRRHHIPARDR